MILKNKGIKEVFVVGLALDYCVGLTALDARAAGLETTVIEEGTKGIAPATVEGMMKKWKEVGVQYRPLKECF